MDAVQGAGIVLGVSANLAALVALVAARGKRGEEVERFARWAKHALLVVGVGLLLGLAQLAQLVHQGASDTEDYRATWLAMVISGGMNCGADSSQPASASCKQRAYCSACSGEPST